MCVHVNVYSEEAEDALKEVEKDTQLMQTGKGILHLLSRWDQRLQEELSWDFLKPCPL